MIIAGPHSAALPPEMLLASAGVALQGLSTRSSKVLLLPLALALEAFPRIPRAAWAKSSIAHF
eukprot:3867399-Pyramimonas_sp.AAC.1